MTRYPILLISILGGCALVSLENAQHSADVAAAAAANCPAAFAAASEARNSANHAQQAAQDYQTHQDQARALQEEVARARSEADLYRRRAQDAAIEHSRLQQRKSETREDAALMAQSCRLDAAAYREDEAEGFTLLMDESFARSVDEGKYALPVCDCGSASECDDAAEFYSDEAAFLATSDRLLAEAQAAADENRAAAQRAEERARELERQAELEYAQAARAEARVKEEEERAAAAAEAAQEIAFEQCGTTDTTALGPTPAPGGSYAQDIFGAQQRGLAGSACSPAMQASCATIQIMCIASCTAGGASCSPGAPAGCLSCFAAGCF